jgi:hypothetical protein
MAQRIMQYQAAIQLAQGAPQIYDLPQLHRQMLEVLGIKNVEKLVPVDDDLKPRDPISENMAFLNGKPVKAFIYQDHDAHIAVHTTFMKDPMIGQTMGQNPMAQQMMAATMAHISEHLAFAYRRKIEEQMGVTMPAPDSELPEDVEVQLARLTAQAATQLLQLNMAQAQQAQAQQAAQDPMMQLQQAELQLKGKEVELKGQKIQGDLQIKQAELQLKAQEMASKQGEDPALAQQRHAQTMQQTQQAHEQQLTHAQQAQQQKMAAAVQANQLKQQLAAQKSRTPT